MNVGELQVGRMVRTNYDTRDFKIASVSGPCTCPEYVRSLSPGAPPSEAHYHLTITQPSVPRYGTGYLAGYRPDGTNVWSKDYLTFGELAKGTQQQLF